MVEVSRRQFLKIGAGGLLGLYAGTLYRGFGATPVAEAQVPGGTLEPAGVPKFVTPMLIPPVMPKAGTIKNKKGKNADYYEIAMKPLTQQILPGALPMTPVWGYGAVAAGSKKGMQWVNFHHAPSLTIEADYNRPTRIKWINGLVDGNGDFVPHLLPVDPTLHWANPPQGSDPAVYGTGSKDSRPIYSSTPGRYTGPVPIVTHVHGAIGVGDESDGYTEAWYLPVANDIPDGYAKEGTWYEFFKSKAATTYGATWGPGFATFEYPNLGRAAAIWYHDHALGMTRLNVYAGPAGFYFVRGGPAGDKAVLDSRTGTVAVLPGPAPKEGDAFPLTKTYYEIPIAIQDRSFNTDGSLFYPNSREFFDGIVDPDDFVPGTFSPIWNPEFFGNMIMVNGNTWPFQKVEQRRYRFRFLNGCQSRFLILDFNGIPNVEVYAIGNEGGFLSSPVNLTTTNNNRLLMALAERADLIVDFTNVPVGSYVLENVGPDEPFGGGIPGEDFPVADSTGTGQIMQFRVVPRVSADVTTPPQFLQLPALAPLPAATVTRPLALIEAAAVSTTPDPDPNNPVGLIEGPVEALLGTVGEDGKTVPMMWMEPVTENPAVGATEVWEIYNTTMDAHPMHVHEVAFEVVNREGLVLNDMGDVVQPIQLDGNITLPESWETGVKDTLVAYPGQVTRIKMTFSNPGQFVWHCHIVEHEDNEMMRPYRIGDEQPGQPGAMMMP